MTQPTRPPRPSRRRAKSKLPAPTLANYDKIVSVLIVPQVHPDNEKHVLPGSTLFWLHTYGMSRYGLPDIEVRDVPALWVEGAGDFLNGWALYMIREKKEIRAGETLASGFMNMVKVRASASPDPWWGERKALRLEAEVVLHACAECGGHGHEHDEEMVH